MPDYERDPRVDEYIDKLPDWQRAICHEVRDLVHAADPEVEETVKRTVQPYFVLQGNVIALLAAKDHVNVFLYDGGITADPEVAETIKRSRQPYFVLDGNICALLATKDHVNVFLYDGGIVPDPDGIITAGHDNKTARTVAVYRDEPVKASALVAMFKNIIANNRAGGWRKVKAARGE